MEEAAFELAMHSVLRHCAKGRSKSQSIHKTDVLSFLMLTLEGMCEFELSVDLLIPDYKAGFRRISKS